MELYQVFSTQDGIYTKIIFKDAADCLNLTWLIVLLVILTLIGIIVGLLICRKKQIFCCATINIVINNEWTSRSDVECSDLKKRSSDPKVYPIEG